MKKLFRSFAVAFVALGLFVGLMPLAAFAAGGAAPEEDCTLTIHKYANDPTATTQPTPIPPTGGIQIVPSGFLPVYDIEFSIWKVLPDAKTGVYPDDATKIDVTNSAHVDMTSNQTGKTDANGELKFDIAKDKQGVYLVKETNSTGKLDAVNGPDINFAPITPFMVQIPMTEISGADAGVGWLKDVHVYPKNQTMTPTKTPNGGNPKPVQPGDVVTWTIEAPLPADMSKIKEYAITDTVDPTLLELDDTSVKVSTSDTKGGTQTSLAAENFTVGLSATKDKMTVALTAAGRAEIVARQAYAKPHMYVQVKLNTKVTDKAAGLSVENGAGVELKDNNGREITEEIPQPEKPFVYSGVLPIQKFGKNDTQPLEGAKFKVAYTKDDALKGKFVKMADGTTDLEVKTDDDGKAVLKGLKFGQENVKPGDLPSTYTTSFWLVETEAPKGYNKLQAPIEVVFDYGTYTEGQGQDQVDYHSVVKGVVKIYNTANFTLPLTGSTGIVLSTILGVLLVGGMIGIVFYRKSKEI